MMTDFYQNFNTAALSQISFWPISFTGAKSKFDQIMAKNETD